MKKWIEENGSLSFTAVLIIGLIGLVSVLYIALTKNEEVKVKQAKIEKPINSDNIGCLLIEDIRKNPTLWKSDFYQSYVLHGNSDFITNEESGISIHRYLSVNLNGDHTMNTEVLYDDKEVYKFEEGPLKDSVDSLLDRAFKIQAEIEEKKQRELKANENQEKQKSINKVKEILSKNNNCQ